jgi:hypothetical protein
MKFAQKSGKAEDPENLGSSIFRQRPIRFLLKKPGSFQLDAASRTRFVVYEY